MNLRRRTLLGMAGAVAAGPLWTTAAAAADTPIVKPVPPEDFTVLGTNAELRWDSPHPVGDIVPASRFFVRNHTATPLLDARTWRLEITGDGLRGGPVTVTYDDLLRLPSETITAAIECAGNGRSFFTSQQGQTVAGTAWRLGAIGVARWRGVPLATLLHRAGLARDAVDVLPEGLDADYVAGGVNLGRVRRPLPVAKALDDVLVAYEMNGEPLPPDHGFPARLVVPGWIGIASIKWLGRIQVSRTPLDSPWDTQYYRLTGPDYSPDGVLVTRQNTKSVFELPWRATLAADREHVLRGRSWSGSGGIGRVEVSTDDGRTWRRAEFVGSGGGWQRWTLRWRPRPGEHTMRARAVDRHGVAQPDTEPYNAQGYLFGAVVRHPVVAV
ncbi:molybdopterin-binding oxidoreductase protein [Amycolatopsis methanolica 239]|uniref:Molybdopterin-binding oxidoreductase protein n=2 Tax=Amycolatopsis methanolica TaxID=1814 RepID=A0A076MXW3_AMYME|nr:molybdopterin-binding oxidoreductase protein [Amycolatopsis methanolica 239]